MLVIFAVAILAMSAGVLMTEGAVSGLLTTWGIIVLGIGVVGGIGFEAVKYIFNKRNIS